MHKTDLGKVALDELAEAVDQTSYCTLRNLAKFLDWSKNTALRRLIERDYENWHQFGYPTACLERKRQRIVKLLLYL